MNAKKILDETQFAVNRRRSALAHIFKVFYIIGELAVVNASIIASFYIIYSPQLATFNLSFNNYISSIPFLVVFGIIYIDLFGMTHFYRKTRMDLITSSFQFSFLLLLTATTIAFFLKWYAFPRYVLLVSGAVMVVLSSAWSIFCLSVSKKIYARGKLMIVASDQADADRLYGKIRCQLRELHLEYKGYTCTSEIRQIHRLINRCTEVMVSSTVSDAIKSDILLYCASRDKTVYIVPQFSDLILAKYRVIQFYDMPTFMIDSLGLTFQQRLLKRAFDIGFSLMALVLTLPFQLVIGLVICLTSQGPALYSQERVTLSGKIYKVYKFRTMVDQAEQRYGAFQSRKHDPRVTRIGRFLREHRIDELPQFLNILRGDLSVVGPRSDRPTTIGQFEDDIPGYDQRLKVKAGLTGLAQIYGKYDTDPEDKLRFDMMYIKNYSFLLDVKIIFQTIQAVLTKNIYQELDKDDNFEIR